MHRETNPIRIRSGRIKSYMTRVHGGKGTRCDSAQSFSEYSVMPHASFLAFGIIRMLWSSGRDLVG